MKASEYCRQSFGEVLTIGGMTESQRREMESLILSHLETIEKADALTLETELADTEEARQAMIFHREAPGYYPTNSLLGILRSALKIKEAK